MNGQLAGSLEDNILTLLCYSEKYAARVVLEVKVSLFSSKIYQRIAEEAIQYLDKYHTAPRTHIRDLLERELTRGETKDYYHKIIDAMEALEAQLQPDYVLSQLDFFIQCQELKQSVENAADLLHAGKLEEARAALATTTPRLKSDNGVFLNDTAKWFKFLDVKEDDFISSGIRALDERGVVPAKKEMFMMIAPTGRGKSFWLIEAGKTNLIEHHKNVCHITLENSLEVTAQRYTQAMLGLTRDEIGSLRIPLLKLDSLGRFSSFNFDQISPDNLAKLGKKTLAKRIKPFQSRGRLYLHWFPEGTLTIPQLHSFLDSLEKLEGFKPDILILDYVNKMQLDSTNLRISVGSITSQLRGLAGIRDLALLTATQGNRSSDEARTVGRKHVAEDWSMAGTTDTLITYSQTSDEREIGLARILVAKARTAQDGWLALITQSYATGQFCLDSCYFNKLVESEIGRLTGEDDD